MRSALRQAVTRSALARCASLDPGDSPRGGADRVEIAEFDQAITTGFAEGATSRRTPGGWVLNALAVCEVDREEPVSADSQAAERPSGESRNWRW